MASFFLSHVAEKTDKAKQKKWLIAELALSSIATAIKVGFDVMLYDKTKKRSSKCKRPVVCIILIAR